MVSCLRTVKDCPSSSEFWADQDAYRKATLELLASIANSTECSLLAARFTIGMDLYQDGDVLTPGAGGTLPIQIPGVILEALMLADSVGSAVVDIRKTNVTAYPAGAVSICGTSKLTITNDIKVQDSALTGWSKLLSKDDILIPYVESCSGITELTIALLVSR